MACHLMMRSKAWLPIYVDFKTYERMHTSQTTVAYRLVHATGSLLYRVAGCL